MPLALQIVSNIDDVSYWLCTQGFFGRVLQEQSHKVKKITLIDRSLEEDTTETEGTTLNNIIWKRRLRTHLHTLISLILFLCMVIGWGVILNWQVSGTFYRMKFPQCQVQLQGYNITNIGDGKWYVDAFF